MNTYKSFKPDEISQGQLHGHLLSAVAPRPICFASTIDKEGNVNLSPFSYFNVFSSNPPLLVFSPARRGKDNTTKHTYENVKDVPDVVISMVNYPMVEQMSLSSTEFAKGVNEFEKSGFTEVKSTLIKPPRVGESPVSFECKVNDIISLGEIPGAGNLVLSEVVMIHINDKYLDDQGKIDSVKMDFVARMGGSYYSRIIPESLFEIPKPLSEIGIGVDSLPEHIRNSKVLSGNNLGRLGNLKSLPSSAEIEFVKTEAEVIKLLSTPTDEFDVDHQLQMLAKEWIENGEPEKALALLLVR